MDEFVILFSILQWRQPTKLHRKNSAPLKEFYKKEHLCPQRPFIVTDWWVIVFISAGSYRIIYFPNLCSVLLFIALIALNTEVPCGNNNMNSLDGIRSEHVEARVCMYCACSCNYVAYMSPHEHACVVCYPLWPVCLCMPLKELERKQ